MSPVEICNLALSNIRAGSINSLNESSVQAQQCKLKYDILRNRCLRETDWQFSRKIKALSLLTIEVFNWSKAYSYPVDCLKINRVMGEHEKVTASSHTVNTPSLHRRQQTPYEVFNFDDVKVIGASQENLYIDYVALVDDPNLYSDDFVIALSHLLASEIAIPIVGGELGQSLRGQSLELYSSYIASAATDNHNDQYLPVPDSEYVTVRS